tara:strand:- start:113 stop:262 length:150 start_codon:yes stop_codon:yes gene_type:complete
LSQGRETGAGDALAVAEVEEAVVENDRRLAFVCGDKNALEVLDAFEILQ